MSTSRWRWAGDRSLLCAFPDEQVADANAAARALAARIRSLGEPGVEDVVPGARTVLVVLRPGTEPPRALLDAIEAPVSPAGSETGARHDVEVSYGGQDGPDLAELAAQAGMSDAEAVRAHVAPLYTVAFIGFAPGFPYLLGLDPRLRAPRLPSPRARVPAGSVAIGGAYTGVYPSATPGGWRLLGRTDATMFDPSRARAATLAQGDRVRFVAR